MFVCILLSDKGLGTQLTMPLVLHTSGIVSWVPRPLSDSNIYTNMIKPLNVVGVGVLSW